MKTSERVQALRMAEVWLRITGYLPGVDDHDVLCVREHPEAELATLFARALYGSESELRDVKEIQKADVRGWRECERRLARCAEKMRGHQESIRRRRHNASEQTNRLARAERKVRMIVYAVVVICLLVIGGYAYGMIFK